MQQALSEDGAKYHGHYFQSKEDAVADYFERCNKYEVEAIHLYFTTGDVTYDEARESER